MKKYSHSIGAIADVTGESKADIAHSLKINKRAKDFIKKMKNEEAFIEGFEVVGDWITYFDVNGQAIAVDYKGNIHWL